ncbi:hypothetical protein M9458_048519, partial [Cirrhinus mrigala]
ESVFAHFEQSTWCPEMDNQQETITSLEDARIPEPQRFWVITKSCACWRPLCPETPEVAELTDRYPEGTEKRWAPYNEVYTSLPVQSSVIDIRT